MSDFEGSPLDMAIRDRGWVKLCEDYEKEPGDIDIEEMACLLDEDTCENILDIEALYPLLQGMKDEWDNLDPIDKQGQQARDSFDNGMYDPI